MLTEYKIKLEKDGLTITQSLDSGTSQPLATFTASNALQASFQQSKSANAANPKSGGSAIDDPGPGGGGFTGSGAAPITIIGPNIFICCPCSHPHQEKKEEKS
jgi:hypothetical protein